MARQKPIDWYRIKQLVLKSFTGRGMTEDETRECHDAMTRAPEEYSERSRLVREAERQRIRKGGF